MDIRRLTIFTLLLIFICSLGSTYIFKKDTQPQETHTPQREIERQLSLPDKTAFIHTQVNDFTIPNNETSVQSIKDRFQAKFQQLQNVTNEKINTLLNKANNEYKTKVKNGEKSSLTDFYQRMLLKHRSWFRKRLMIFY